METGMEAPLPTVAQLACPILTKENIDQYCNFLQTTGRQKVTCRKYRRILYQFWQFLPEEKRIESDSLEKWREHLLKEEAADRTVAFSIIVVNGYLEHIQRWDLRLKGKTTVDKDTAPDPVLTRAEYLRLLSTAKNLENERLFYVVKLYALTGIRSNDLAKVTVQAVKDGYIRDAQDEKRILLRFPRSLREELLAYAKKNHILSGSLIVTRTGKSVSRENIFRELRDLSHDACVDEKKATPKCLRNLYKTTYDVIFAQVYAQAQQNYEKLLEEERRALEL